MSDAPERIWVGVSERGDLAINHKGEKLNGYDHVEYVRADRIEALTEQLTAARQDAKEAEAYAEELERELNTCRMAQAVMDNTMADVEAKLAKAVEALDRIASITVHSGGKIHGVTAQHWRTAFEVAQDEATITLALLTEKPHD